MTKEKEFLSSFGKIVSIYSQAVFPVLYTAHLKTVQGSSLCCIALHEDLGRALHENYIHPVVRTLLLDKM